MEVSRFGSVRPRGEGTLVPRQDLKRISKPPRSWSNENVLWDNDREEIVVSLRWIRHSDGITHHNYRVALSLEDVSVLIAVLAEEVLAADPSLLRDNLADQLPALTKLLCIASGWIPTSIDAKPAAVAEAM